MRTAVRLLSLLLATAMIAAGAIAGSTAAHATEYRDEVTWPYLNFDDNGDGTATITGCVSTCNSSYPLEIPATVEAFGEQFEVTAIADEAFQYEYLDEVTLPAGLESIGAHAFDGNRLTSITLPSSLTTVGTDAFGGNSLGTLTIPAALTDMGESAFRYAGITDITWLGAPTSITAGSFSSNELVSLTLPPSVTSIGESAFGYNDALDTVILPPHLESIGDSAFSNNSSLATITYPGSTPVEPRFPSTLTSIGAYAFDYGSLSGVLTLPDGLTHLGEGAFSDNAFTEVVVPDGLTTIPYYAFAWNQIDFAVIPASVTTIGASAFVENPLEVVSFLGDEPATDQWSLGAYLPPDFPPPVVIYDMANEGFGHPTWTAGGTTFPTQPGTAVEFVTDHGIAPEPQYVDYDDLVSEPDAPEADWHTFLGWFTQPQGGEPWDFDGDTVTSGLTLHAQWEAVTHIVTFEFGSHADTVEVSVDHGETAIAPEPPFLPGHRFTGWTHAGEPADFDAAITEPVSFAAVYEASTYAVEAPEDATAGDTVTVTGTGFDPDETVTLELHSTPVPLGTTTADATGAFSTDVTIPADAPAGSHEIVAWGAAGQASAPITLTVPAEPAGPAAPGDPAEPGEQEQPSRTPGSGESGDELATTGAGDMTAPLTAASALLLVGTALLTLRRRVN